MSSQDLLQKAQKALQDAEPAEAKAALEAAVEAHPHRLDLHHALTVVCLRLGEPVEALQRSDRTLDLARELADDAAHALMAQILLTRAAIYEDLARPAQAIEVYREVLRNVPDHPSAQQALGHLLLASGQADEGRALLEGFVKNPGETAEIREAEQMYLDALDRFRRDEIHPGEFLTAHRESYVEFFDQQAKKMAKKGWIAEAAKMRRDGDRLVPVVPEGARPYATIRVDLVDPTTGQGGMIGEEPMIVALEGYEALGHAPVLLRAPSEDGFDVWISSQCPWDLLPVVLRFRGPGGIEAADAVIGDWYTAGFTGAFGDKESGRFHYISDPEVIGPALVAWQLDCGRARREAIDDLLRRLAVLHSQHPLQSVLFGRGFSPE